MMLSEPVTQIVPPHETQGTAQRFLRSHYAEVRKRLGVSTRCAIVPRKNIRDGSRLYVLNKYDKPIGPRRLVYPKSAAPLSASQAILVDVANKGGARIVEILSRRRQAHLVRLRAIMAHRLLGLGLSYPQTGRIMDNRDHTTIMYLVATFDENGERIR